MGRKSLANTVMTAVLMLTGLVAAFAIAACGGGEQADPAKADIGKAVVIAPWQITLNGVPQTMNVAGEGGITYGAQNGTFVIVPVTVANQGSDTILFPTDLVFLQDGQGRKFPVVGSSPQFAYQQGHKDLDILIDSPLAGGKSRNTFVMFDVPTDAKSFTMTFNGSDQTFKLGY
jgi:hypothetical protein